MKSSLREVSGGAVSAAMAKAFNHVGLIVPERNPMKSTFLRKMFVSVIVLVAVQSLAYAQGTPKFRLAL